MSGVLEFEGTVEQRLEKAAGIEIAVYSCAQGMVCIAGHEGRWVVDWLSFASSIAGAQQPFVLGNSPSGSDALLRLASFDEDSIAAASVECRRAHIVGQQQVAERHRMDKALLADVDTGTA